MTKEYVRGGNKNKLSDDNRKRILSAYVERKDEDYFSKLIPNREIAENDYNIAVSSYIEQENKTEDIDIEQLNAGIAEIVIKQNHLRTAIDEIVADLESSV